MSKTNTRMLLRCAVFAALTAVGAFIRIPFALSSITLQFFFTAMAGLVLGARWGAASQAIYVLLGLAGLPIFSAAVRPDGTVRWRTCSAPRNGTPPSG